jgi:hypothetical protein
MFNRYRSFLMEGADPVATGSQPASAPAPVATPPVPAPAPAAAPSENQQKLLANEEMFNKRLAEAGEAAQRKLLKELGIDDPKAAKKALDDAKKLQQEKLSAEERLQARIAELEPLAKEAETSRQYIERLAKKEFDALPKAAQDFVAKMAGDDWTKRADAIASAHETGMIAALTAIAPSAAPAQSRPANPATTGAAPGPTPPAPTGASSELQQYTEMKSRGQTRLAAQFYERNATVIEQQRAASKTQ